MGKTYLVLHKREWERLHRRTDDPHRLTDQRDEYFRKLMEKSQSWIKTWPDTVEGYVAKVAKQKEKQHTEEVAVVKKGFHKKKQEDAKEAIKKARQLIFEDSCYGKQLNSALMESKNLEEREIQIDFKKKVKKQMKQQEKERLSKLNLDQCSFNLGKEKEMKQLNRATQIELANINKSIYEMEISKKKKLKQDQIKMDLENAKLMQELLDNEAKKEKEYEMLLRKDVKHYENEQILARERREKREKLDEALAQAQRKEMDRKHFKINRIMKQIHEDKHNTKQYQRNYETTKTLQQEETIRYEEFVQKGLKKSEERNAKKATEEAEKKILDLEARSALAKSNKLAFEEAVQLKQAEKHYNKCVGDRQSILLKSCDKRKFTRTGIIKDKQPFNTTVPSKLKEELIVRKAQPSPWNGLAAAHAHFAENAGNTLRECQHKRFARKVVDEYRRLNGLDATSLPVPNY